MVISSCACLLARCGSLLGAGIGDDFKTLRRRGVRAKDLAADETLPGWKRTIRELQYWLMMGIPIVLVVGVFVLGEFGKFFAMLFRGMFGYP